MLTLQHHSFSIMTTEEGLIVGNYVHKNPNEDPEVSAQNLLPKFNGKYDYGRILQEVHCWRRDIL